VTSAEVLAQAAIADGKSAQAFPSFGPERRGAPVIAFARVADDKIRNRTAIQKPNVVIVLDPSLLRLVKVDAGLTPDGLLVINTSRTSEEIRKQFGFTCRMGVVDANKIAREEIGRVITNTTMLGAALAAEKMASIATIEDALHKRFGSRIAPKNINAFHRAQKETRVVEATTT
jgi:pyruvate ferredoxin oxidoreductase gamma subunit